jgi:hypothetical protein
LLNSYGFPYIDLLAPVIILLEVILAFLFFVHHRVKTISLCSIVLMLLFTAVYTFGLTLQGVTDCGCFGVLQLPEFPPYWVYIRNVFLLVLLNYLYFSVQNEIAEWSRRRWIVFCAYIGILMFVAGISFRPNAFLPVKEHPLTSQSISDTPLREHVPQTQSALVLCYGYQCSHCMNTMENVLAMQRYGIVDTVVAIAVVPEDMDVDSARMSFHRHYPQIGNNEIAAQSIPQITLFPTSLLIEQDTIRQVFVGELPNPFLIEKSKIIHK